MGMARKSAMAVVLILTAGAACSYGQGATYKTLVFTGQPAPGGATFGSFGVPRIGADGSVGFVGVDVSGETPRSGVYAGKADGLRLVAKAASIRRAIVGFSDFYEVSVSKDGLVAFTASSLDDSLGIWSEGSGGGLTLDTKLSFESLGAVAFRGGMPAAKAIVSEGESVQQAVLFGPTGSVVPVIAEDEILGTLRIKSIFDSSPYPSSVGSSLDLSESGTAILKMSVAPQAGPSPIPKKAIYAGSPTALRPVAVEGDAAPGLSGSQFVYLSPKPTVAKDGFVAFTSSLYPYSGQQSSAVFTGQPGAIAPVVVAGSIVPTTTNVVFEDVSDAVVNSTGDVIFRAKIRYSDESSRKGIWVKRRTGPPVLLAIDGMTLPTPSGDREVTAVDFAGPGTFNDLHQFVFLAHFGETDQGIYLADTRPGAPVVFIRTPRKPRDFVTTASFVKVAGKATDDTGVASVEYTVAREASARGKKPQKRGKRLIVSRVQMANGSKNWSFKVPLSMGLNLVSVVATDKLGNKSEPYRVRMLRYSAE
jgi:hypothetical protein